MQSKSVRDLTSNNSRMLALEIYFEPEFKNDYFKELYYAKETGNFENIRYIIDHKNFIKVNPTFTYLYEKIYWN